MNIMNPKYNKFAPHSAAVLIFSKAYNPTINKDIIIEIPKYNIKFSFA